MATASSVDEVDFANADDNLVGIVEGEYAERLRRTDSLYEQLDAKAQRIASLVLPLGGVAFGVVIIHGDNLACETRISLWSSVSMLVASGLLAIWAMRLRRYSGTSGFVPRTPQQFARLDSWLHGSTPSSEAVKKYRIMRIKRMDLAIERNDGQNSRKAWCCKWSLSFAAATLPVALLVFLASPSFL